jgi:hypothetical protein
VRGGFRSVTGSVRPLLEFRCPAECSSDRASSRIGFESSPHVLDGLPLDSRVFARSAFRVDQSHLGDPLLSLRSPSEFSAHRAAALVRPGRSRSSGARRPPLGFAPLQRLPAQGSGTTRAGLPTPDRPAPPGFLNLLTPRSAPSLPALFRAGSAHGVHPSELCSSRAAAHRLRCRCPHVVSKALSRRFPATSSLHPCRNMGSVRPPLSGDLPGSPPPSGLCSTRESATSLRLFTPPGARSSPGIHPLQGLLPHRNGTTFIAPPLMGLPARSTNQPRGRPFRVFLRGEIS